MKLEKIIIGRTYCIVRSFNRNDRSLHIQMGRCKRFSSVFPIFQLDNGQEVRGDSMTTFPTPRAAVEALLK